jgi:hypothetical protein
MRTAVVRIDVDPTGRLTPAELSDGMAVLRANACERGVEVIDTNLAAMPARRRQVELLVSGSDRDEVTGIGISMCTYVSRGTDDDAYGVLARFGLTGDIERTPGDGGFDIVYVTLQKADLERVPESRIHTALEASLNCEVHIRTT